MKFWYMLVLTTWNTTCDWFPTRAPVERGSPVSCFFRIAPLLDSDRSLLFRSELEQILWHSADAPVTDGRAERLEADVKSLKKKLREAELRLEGIPVADGAGEGEKTVANLLAQNEALAKELLDARDPRVKQSLLSTLERYRRELVDKHAASTAPPSALGSIWPFGSTAASPSPPGLGMTAEERLLHEQERNQAIKCMMQERIDRLSTLLTGERQARRDAQHWCKPCPYPLPHPALSYRFAFCPGNLSLLDTHCRLCLVDIFCEASSLFDSLLLSSVSSHLPPSIHPRDAGLWSWEARWTSCSSASRAAAAPRRGA